MLACLHCGTPVPAGAADSRFCCTGCSYVHDLLLSRGLDQFYELRGAHSLPPVPVQAMRSRDYAWLEEQVADAETAARAAGGLMPTLRLAVQGVSCMGCVWLMEELFNSMPGARRLDVRAARGELQMEWDAGVFDVVAFARQLQSFGYLAGVADDTDESYLQSSGFNRRLGLCGAFAMNAMAFCLPAYLGMESDFLFAPWFDIIAACSATLSLLVGGSYFAESSFHGLRLGVLHIDTPIILGILAAWGGSMFGWVAGIPSLKYFDFVAVFVFLMLAGRWLQSTAVEKNRKRLLKSTAVPDKTVRVEQDGTTIRIPLFKIKAGDMLAVSPGEVCPVGSVLDMAQASLSLEWINGESQAAIRTAGQHIPSGAVNIGTQPLRVTAQETWDHSLLHRLAKSRGSGKETSLFLKRLLRGYLAVVIVIGIAGALGWLMTGHGAAKALQVMISVFVVSCPCALGVAAPFADDLAATWMERLGVFVKASNLWARLGKVRHVIFDKTGTLTLENPVLTSPEALEALQPEARNALHHLSASNLHPVSRSLFDALGMGAWRDEHEADCVEEVIAQGLRFRDAHGSLWALGRPGWRGGEMPACDGLEPCDAELSVNGRLVAGFTCTDALRPETVSASQALSRAGYELYLFSGDRPEKVAGIARSLGVPPMQWQGSMTPEQKAARVRAINRDDTLFIGDGANDSLAVEASLCAGSPVTGRNFLEHKADFFFLGNSLRFVPTLLEIARRRMRAVKRVFAFAIIYNIGAILLSLAGWMSPLLAAILMPASSVVTLGIARLALGKQPVSAVATAPLDDVSLTGQLDGRPSQIIS